MLGLQTHADESSRQLLETRHPGHNPQQQRRFERAGVVQNAIQNPVRKQLHTLGIADSALAIMLNVLEIVHRQPAQTVANSARMLALATASCKAMLIPIPPTGDMA